MIISLRIRKQSCYTEDMRELAAILLEEFWEELKGTSKSVLREVHFPSTPEMINVAIGMRRSGKSYFLYQKIQELIKENVKKEQIFYINFEDDRLLPMKQKELAALLDTFYTIYPENHERVCYFFLDEIQNVEEWALVIRRYFEKKKIHLYLSGSSAKLLSTEIATSLRGRSIATEIWPYSFSEYLTAHHHTPPPSLMGKKTSDTYHHYFCDYLLKGGFPAVQHINETDRRRVLQGYVTSVIFRDIVERYKITNTTILKYLIRTMIQNIASPFVANKFYRDCKSQGLRVGKDTIYQYIDHIEDAYLLFQVPLYTTSVRKMQANPKKIYAIDTGLVVANTLKPNWGNLFENQTFLDLRREGKQVFYYLTENGYEIDFLTQDVMGNRELIQVVWDISSKETLERETRALKQAEKELGIKGQILTPKDFLRK